MRTNWLVTGLIAWVFALLLMVHFCLSVDAQTPTRFPNCRLGVAVARNPIDVYNLDGLNLGWYVKFWVADDPPRPGGIEFVQTVRVHQSKNSWQRDDYVVPYTYTVSPDPTTLRNLVMANPGFTWAIGNNPDRRDWEMGNQDEIVPKLYAQAYYEISQLIRQADPTAKLTIGGVIQPTPLRLKYLDRVWSEYHSRYGRRLGDDVDLWNANVFVLNEASCKDIPFDCQGAEIPAGLTDAQGLRILANDNDNLDLFKQEVKAFREWMLHKGERNKPFYVTDYGINMPPNIISSVRVMDFMNKTFDYLLNATDSSLGYPVDSNRLVQRFIWYSLDDSQDSPGRVDDYADSLFNSITHHRQEYGDNWAAYVADSTHTEANVPRVNLLVTRTQTIPPWYAAPSAPVAFTLRANVHNNGNTRSNSGDGLTVDFYEGTPNSPGPLIGSQVISDVCGCGLWTVVNQTWVLDPVVGTYPWFVQVEVLAGETSPADNVATGVAIIAGPQDHKIYLPIILAH